MRFNRIVVCITFFVTLAACSSSGPIVEDTTPREPTIEEKLEALSRFEDFDPTPYPSDAILQDEGIEHAVPQKLLDGTASDGLGATRTGYRVQIALVREKNRADGLVDEVTQWLQRMKEEEPNLSMFQTELPVYNIYLQPYFRIRIGDFSGRDAAEVLLSHIVEEYPGALIVTDEVTIN